MPVTAINLVCQSLQIQNKHMTSLGSVHPSFIFFCLLVVEELLFAGGF